MLRALPRSRALRKQEGENALLGMVFEVGLSLRNPPRRRAKACVSAGARPDLSLLGGLPKRDGAPGAPAVRKHPAKPGAPPRQQAQERVLWLAGRSRRRVLPLWHSITCKGHDGLRWHHKLLSLDYPGAPGSNHINCAQGSEFSLRFVN